MKKDKVSLACLSLAVAFTFVFPACGPEKKPISRKKIEEKGLAAVELIKTYGLSLYPGTELMDQSVKSSKIPVPGTDQPGKTMTVKVLTVSGVTYARLDEVRSSYEKQAPNVITEEKINDSVRFVQLSNVSDFNKALAERVSPILLINLRRKMLTENERLAYQNEYNNLQSVSNPDAIQKRRKAQLDNFLKDNTFIQVNVRTQE